MTAVKNPRNQRAARLPAKLSRSWLLISAAKKDEFAPCMASEADSVILDLEAGVADDKKDEARVNVVDALNGGMTGWVRISQVGTDDWEKDLEALSDVDGLRGVMLAMTEKPEQISYTAMRLGHGIPVIALVETAVGIENAVDIAQAPGTFRLAFGVNDYRKDVGVSAEPIALAYARSRLVSASRVGGLPGAIDGPPGLDDEVAHIRDSTQHTTSMGMTGRLVLDRTQVEIVNNALAPQEDEMRWAKEMLDAHSQGATVGDGSYLPRLARARKIADLADSYGLWNL